MYMKSNISLTATFAAWDITVSCEKRDNSPLRYNDKIRIMKEDLDLIIRYRIQLDDSISDEITSTNGSVDARRGAF